MKTNEQMIEDLLERKKAYDKKQAVKRRRFAVITATLAAILILSSIPVIALVANKKAPAPAEVKDYSITDDENNTMDSQKEIITEVYTNDNTETQKITPDEKLSGRQNSEPIYFDISHTKLSGESGSEMKIFDKPLAPKICLHENIKEYEINVTCSENFGDNKAYLVVLPSVSIELLSDDINTLVFENNNMSKVTLRFKYKDGYTNGRIYYYIFNEEDCTQFCSEINEHITNGGLGDDYATFTAAETLGYFAKLKYSLYGGEALCFAEIKGYDFEGYEASTPLYKVYWLAAQYFGDVDKDGNPLYLSDPYMPEYYDNPDCYIKRKELEKPFIKINSEESRGDSDISSPFALYKNESIKGINSQNYVNIYGDIYWSDKNSVSHPAKNIKVAVYDSTGINLLDYSYTNVNGVYYLHFCTDETGYIDVKIKAYSYGQGVNVKKEIDGNTAYTYECSVMNVSLSVNNIAFLPSKVYPFNTGSSDEKTFNRSLSVHQSLELANRYVNNLAIEREVYWLNVLYYDSLYNYDGDVVSTCYDYVGNTLYAEYYDAFDWDVIEHEYGHYIEDIFGFLSIPSGNNMMHTYYDDLLTMQETDEYGNYYNPPVYYTKEKAIKMAWFEGWADFFAMNVQRVMIGANDIPIPNVNDSIYRDTEIPRIYFLILSGFYDDIIIDIESFVDLSCDPEVIYKGETNEITIAALLLDYVDGLSPDDNDPVCLSDSAIWNIIIGDEDDPDDGCKTLSEFMIAFHNSTLLSKSEKFGSLYLLRRYELNPYNVNVTNLNTNSPLVTWTNISTSNYNMIRVYDTSYNEICTPVFLTNQTSYNIPAAAWNQIKSGRTAVYIVVEGISSNYPMTARYFSYPKHVSIP